MRANWARGVEDSDFRDATWQERNAVTKAAQLLAWIDHSVPARILANVEDGLVHAPMAMRITPYLLSLIDWSDYEHDPIRRQFIPLKSEMRLSHPLLRLDSLAEREQSPVDGLVHRYPDKALFLATDRCPVYCRFCTRSYSIGLNTETVAKMRASPTVSRWQAAFDYLRATPEIVDVVVSGGDCFRLKAKQITEIGEALISIPSIRRIRFATKGLAVLPMKITTDHEWTDALSAIHQMGRSRNVEVSLHTHFNHPREITGFTEDAARILFQRGIPMRNQSVVMDGVNNGPETMRALVKRLSDLHIHPYYVYACDLVEGTEELRVPIREVCELERQTRGITAGYNTPTFVVDAPGGGGKRDVHSYDFHDDEIGLTFYRSPNVDLERIYVYPDPLHSLDEKVQKRWLNPVEARTMFEAAIARVSTLVRH